MAQANHGPTPPHLLDPTIHRPSSTNPSSNFNPQRFPSPPKSHPRDILPGSLLQGQLDWTHNGPQFQGFRRTASEYSGVSSATPSPNVVRSDTFKHLDHHYSPIQRPEDAALYEELHGIGSFNIHAPQEAFPQLQETPEIQQGIPALPSLNINFAPTAVRSGFEQPKNLDIDSLTTPERGRQSVQRPRTITVPYNSSATLLGVHRSASDSRGLSPDATAGTRLETSRSLSPLNRAGRLCLSYETDNDILSAFHEHASDAGSAKPTSSRPSFDHLSVIHEFSTDSCGSDGERTEPQHSEIVRVFSREPSPLESPTSITSLRGLVESDQPAQDITDDEDTLSDVTDHTDLSLIEAFETSLTPFDPKLLSVLMSLKEEVVDRIKQRLGMLMHQTNGTQQRPTQDDNSSSPPSEIPLGSTEKISLTNGLKKRSLDEDEGNNPGRGNGGNGEKRKCNGSTSRSQLEERLKKFACPFHKRYPDSENLQKACHGPGWVSVHRVKEHIFRRHRRPTVHCARCLVSFANEEKLDEHLRAESRCENKTALLDEETIYITESQEQALRKRKKNVLEEERWFNAFQVIFPDIPTDQLPSPYHDSYPDPLPDSAILNEFGTFLVRHLPSHIIDDVNNHLRAQSEVFRVQDNMIEVIQGTIREAVEEFLPMLAFPGLGHDETPEVGMAAEWPLRGPTSSAGGPFTPFLPPNTHLIYPPPTCLPPPLPASWNFAPLSNSPYTSTVHLGFNHQLAAAGSTSPFDFGFNNQLPAAASTLTTQVPSSSVSTVSASWAMSEDFGTSGFPPFIADSDSARFR